jgi:hypothetical protein
VYEEKEVEEEEDLLEFGNLNGKNRGKAVVGKQEQKEKEEEPSKALLDLFRAVSSRAEAERRREFEEDYSQGHEVDYGYGNEHGYETYEQHGVYGQWNR